MRTAATFGFPRDGGPAETLAAPSVSLEDQKAIFKSYRGAGTDARFARVELWTSDSGQSKRVHLDAPVSEVTAPAPVEEVAPVVSVEHAAHVEPPPEEIKPAVQGRSRKG